MDKGDSALQRAIDFHKEGNAEKAIENYKLAIKQKTKRKHAYVNLAALLRLNGESNEAGKVVEQGLRETDENSPVLNNTLGNCLRDIGRYEEAIAIYRKAIKYNKGYYDAQLSLVGALYEAGYKKLSDRCLLAMYKFYGSERKGILDQIITREVERAGTENRDLNQMLELILKETDQLNIEEGGKLPVHWYRTAQLCCDSGKTKEAMDYYQKGIDATSRYIERTNEAKLVNKAKELYTVSSWNLACNLLRNGEMKSGWKLYDHGLNTPCEGPQKWQRALFKPFTYSKVPIWRGQDISGKNILLLGEQGIGDTMAFISLTSRLLKKANKITIVVPKRLHEIYERTLKDCEIITDETAREKHLDELNFDYQCPLGSAVQHLYKDVKSFKERYFCLESNKTERDKLAAKYSTIYGENKKPIIGISWQGGGKKERIQDKSIGLGELLQCLKEYNLNLLSLQYGDDEKVVRAAADKYNIRFIDDPDIQATKDMDKWLAQVDVCDGIISIANTTIHGAGGLRKPTLCLLGAKSDWRWLKDEKEKTSYWYPTVEIAWQNKETKSWTDALSQIPMWLCKHKFT